MGKQCAVEKELSEQCALTIKPARSGWQVFEMYQSCVFVQCTRNASFFEQVVLAI